jgi:hypothetical protein
MISHDRPSGHVIASAQAVSVITTWRQNGMAPACPFCPTGRITIVDRSARPHREWYVLSCAECSFEQTVSISMKSPVPGVD